MGAFVRWFLLAFVLAAEARAHDPGLSTTQVELRQDGLVATIGFAPNDLHGLLSPAAAPQSSNWSESDFAHARAGLEKLGPGLLEVRDSVGVLPWARDSVSLATGQSILFKLEAARRPVGRTVLRSMVLDRMPPGHRNYVSVADEKGTLQVTLDLPEVGGTQGAGPAAPPMPTFWGFLALGLTHIWTGYDHLLFLFGLLVVCRSFRSIVGIISCFTVAHSITLALATLKIVSIPSSIVEPMIAASIIYVGVENLVRRGAEPRGRWALTFAFGLIHGFGFASVLRELGIGSHGRGLALPLFTFNLGVELGQVSIALLVLPIVWRLRKNPSFVLRGVPVLSGFVALAGLYWFLERTVF